MKGAKIKQKRLKLLMDIIRMGRCSNGTNSPEQVVKTDKDAELANFKIIQNIIS